MEVFVVIPAFNEKENIQQLIGEILKIKNDLKIVVVDSGSYDGTKEIAQRLANVYSNVKLIRQTERQGKGLAEISGITYALKNKAEYIIVMDADYSHRPQHIPKLLEKIRSYDIVLGSRYVHGSQVISRSVFRRLLTGFSKWFVKTLLNIEVKDPTSGYKCFRREIFEAINLNSLFSKGHFINVEILFKCKRKKFKICEVPIIFKDRERGVTKLKPSLFLEGLFGTFRLLYIKSFGNYK